MTVIKLGGGISTVPYLKHGLELISRLHLHDACLNEVLTQKALITVRVLQETGEADPGVDFKLKNIH